MKSARRVMVGACVGAGLILGCATGDPSERFVQYMYRLPEDQRPIDWEHTIRLMERIPPSVGDIAPDFTLDTLDGDRAITRSVFQEDRPLVLIFGSYT